MASCERRKEEALHVAFDGGGSREVAGAGCCAYARKDCRVMGKDSYRESAFQRLKCRVLTGTGIHQRYEGGGLCFTGAVLCVRFLRVRLYSASCIVLKAVCFSMGFFDGVCGLQRLVHRCQLAQCTCLHGALHTCMATEPPPPLVSMIACSWCLEDVLREAMQGVMGALWVNCGWACWKLWSPLATSYGTAARLPVSNMSLFVVGRWIYIFWARSSIWEIRRDANSLVAW